MLTRIKIKNFKSIGDPGVDLELKPLTLLLGPNGAGKSSVLEAIAFASVGCRWEALLDYNRRYASYAEVIHRLGTQADITAFTNAFGGRYEFFRFGGSSQRKEFVQEGPRLIHLKEDEPIPNSDSMSIRAAQESLEKEFFDKVAFLSSARGFVEATKSAAHPPPMIGTRGEDLLLVLSTIFGSGKHSAIAGQVAEWAAHFGLPQLKAGWRGEAKHGADYTEPALAVPALPLAVASSGARQILCIITEVFWRPARSIILIEEPEISLHPEAQVKLRSLFAQAVKEQKQIIATTHSYFLPRAIVGAVQAKELDVEAVAIYEIVKEPETGTKATRLELDEKGNIKRWIPSFERVEKKLLRDWLKTLPKERS